MSSFVGLLTIPCVAFIIVGHLVWRIGEWRWNSSAAEEQRRKQSRLLWFASPALDSKWASDRHPHLRVGTSTSTVVEQPAACVDLAFDRHTLASTVAMEEEEEVARVVGFERVGERKEANSRGEKNRSSR